MAFPSSLETYTTKVDAVTVIATYDFNDLQRAIENIEAKVGVDNSAVATSFDYKMKSSSDPGHVHTKSPIERAPGAGQTYDGIYFTHNVSQNSKGFGGALRFASDSSLKTADGSIATAVPCVGIAVESGTGEKKVMLKGFVRNDTDWSWTVGKEVYLATNGGLYQLPYSFYTGQRVQVVGVAVGITTIYVNPDPTVVTVASKNLAGVNW